jgi:hypothetical protein
MTSLDSRCICACSEAGFSSQNGKRAYQRAEVCCAFFVEKRLNAKDMHKEMFHAYGRMCLSCKAVHNWVKKFSQGHSKVTDTRPGHSVEIATEATVQWVEEMIRSDRRIMIDSVATALGYSHDLACSIMHDHLKF